MAAFLLVEWVRFEKVAIVIGKLAAGAHMPEIRLSTVTGNEISFGGSAARQRLIIVYRGLHCPICKSYLKAWQEMATDFAALGVDIIAVSGDSREKAVKFVKEVGLTIPVAYDLSVKEMDALGLYVTDPLAHETDRLFPEPGLFLVNTSGAVHICEIANAPFVRPDPALILRGIKVIQERDYPIRGTYIG